MIVVRRDICESYRKRTAGDAGAQALRRAYLAWFAIATAAAWRTPVDVKNSHPKASILKRGRVVFNLKGNDYRLIAQVNYPAGTVEIRFLGSHAEYDQVDAETV